VRLILLSSLKTMFADFLSKFYRQLVLDAFSRGKYGELKIMMPGGASRLFGGLGKELEAKITIKNENFYRRCVFYGALGFAESYLDQEWETDDLTHALAWCFLNREVFSTVATQKHQSRKIDFFKCFTEWKYHSRVNNKKKNREQLHDLYQFGSPFFQAWLGPSMAHSTAYFTSPEQKLEAAQEAKWEDLCQKLRLKSHDYLLDLGCGWGEFAIYAAKKYQCRVQAVTISEEQFRETGLRVEQAGVADLVEVNFCDYRDLNGRFDKIAVIEMLQHVGDRYVETFFSTTEELLAPRGLMVIQASLYNDNEYPLCRDSVNFIQQHILPGSQVLSLRRITEAIDATTNLHLLGAEDRTASAALTYRIWHEKLEKAIPSLQQQGHDPLLIRKWFYYLCYQEALFATYHLSMTQLFYTRPHNYLELASPIYSL